MPILRTSMLHAGNGPRDKALELSTHSKSDEACDFVTSFSFRRSLYMQVKILVPLIGCIIIIIMIIVFYVMCS